MASSADGSYASLPSLWSEADADDDADDDDDDDDKEEVDAEEDGASWSLLAIEASTAAFPWHRATSASAPKVSRSP